MQSSFHENNDSTGKMEEIPESPVLSRGSTIYDDFSESPRVSPRIGDKYQAIVPPFKSQMDYQLGMAENMICNGNTDGTIEKQFAEGLPVPVMQIPCFGPFFGVKGYEIIHVSGPFSDNELGTKDCLSILAVKRDSGLCQQDAFHSADEKCAHELSGSNQVIEEKADSSITDFKREISRVEDTCTDSTVTAENVPDAFYSQIGRKRKRGRIGWKRSNKIKVDSLDSSKQSFGSNCQSEHPKIHNTGEDANLKSYLIVPGSPSAAWSKSEEDLFVLGLYIFGKNFNTVKRFVETKEMGDILSHYYGMFFITEAYCRWAESRKTKSRKCVQGQRIFSGWGQQELLTRLLPNIPEDSKHEVLELAKTFNEGRMSVEDFVTKLKALAGPDVLVQAVGIGKGKQDLTAALIEPAKVNRVPSSRRDIPVGKACSSLSTEEIIKFLTGGFRISKARADDLFWEAVWPRLLARGWHSEQPEDQVLVAHRQSLVFLIPGVQKFSRRKLTKGIHYFDSASAVLSRVESNPRLLELERDDIKGIDVKLEFSENAEVENGDVGHSHCYLQPRFCTNYSESFMFTVVDTSRTSQGEQRLHERVTLPLDNDFEKFLNVSSETDDEDNLSIQVTEQCDCCKHCVVGDLLDDAVDTSLIESGNSKLQRAMLEFHSKEETPEACLGANSSENSTPVLFSNQCSPERSIDHNLLIRDSISANNISNISQNPRGCRMISEMGLVSELLQDQQENTAMNSILPMSSEHLDGSKTEEYSHYESSSGVPNEEPNKKSGLTKALSSGPERCQTAEAQENNASAQPENGFTLRRQSTRVRPLTARAMEAFASGVFDTKRRKKGSEKSLNSDGYRTKSLSRVVQDELTSSFNVCRSDS